MIFGLESLNSYYNLKFPYNIYYLVARLQDQKFYLKKNLGLQYKYQLTYKVDWAFLKYFLHLKWSFYELQ